ncbi:MAG: hypothetical protein AB2L07_06555 [Thermoanaerobaculaceae bacterium]
MKTFSTLSLFATTVLAVVLPPPVSADEALLVSGGGSAQLVFLDRGQAVANNLGAPPASIFRASLQGRLALVTMAGEWRLVSPFRNVPYNQWPPFKVAELPTRYSVREKPEPLQWAPDGRKFLIRLNRTITIHHAGGAPLMTITNTPEVSVAWAANMQWGNDSNHLVLFHVDSRSYYLVEIPARDSLTWEELGRGNAARFFQLSTTGSSTVDRFHFSPDGRQVAFVHATAHGAELWAGLLERPGQVDSDASRNESGWNPQRTEHTRLDEQPTLLPLGWSQDSQRFYYYSQRRTQHVVSDGRLQETAHREQLVRHELKMYDASAGRAWTIMALNWTPWILYKEGYPQPNVSADGRHLVFWGVDNARYQSPSALSIDTDLRERSMSEPDLVVVDLAAKTARAITRKRLQDAPWAAFVKTQDGDGASPPPVTGPRPQAIAMQESSSYGTFDGTWTWNGTDYGARWNNGGEARIRLETMDGNRIVATRKDTAGPSVGLTAVYSASVSGDQIKDGVVTWTFGSSTYSGTWSGTITSWGVSERPPERNVLGAGGSGGSGACPDGSSMRDQIVLVSDEYTARGGGSDPYLTATVRACIEPALVSWIAWDNSPGAGSLERSGPFKGGVDDFIELTVAGPSGTSSTINMDQNDPMGAPFGPQQVIFGSPSESPDVYRKVPFGPRAGEEQTLDEGGAFNTVMTASGTYVFTFRFRDNTGGRGPHGHARVFLLIKNRQRAHARPS